MDSESSESDRSDEQRDSSADRRTLLKLAGAGVTSTLAGCSSFGSTDDTETTTDAQPTSNETTESSETTTASQSVGFDVTHARTSPSSHVAPTDGFADLSWLAGREPAVHKVVTLDGAGKGSLRWALEQQGTRIVVFEVGGVVDLDGDSIALTDGNVFVAGQTAPSPGITLIRGGISIEADDVLLQHLRVRPGDDLSGPIDAIGNQDGSNVIVDHCSTSWATDESISTNSGANNPDVTFTNNLIAESLNDSIHPKGEHAYGTLVMDRSRQVTIAGNLWAHNVGRHPRLKGGTSSVVANNVMYNFERGTNLGGGVSDETTASIVGNYYRGGEQTPESDAVIGATFTDASGGVRAYVAYNETDPSSMPVTGSATSLTLTNERPLWPERLQSVTGGQTYENVLASVGARPSDRTPHDERIVADVRERTGAVIDSQADVGGYPELESAERQLDVPDDGLAEWLHQYTVAVET